VLLTWDYVITHEALTSEFIGGIDLLPGVIAIWAGGLAFVLFYWGTDGVSA
jgi:hypothetical protein